MLTVLVVVACLVGLVVALLAVPLDVAGRMRRERASAWSLELRWLFGLVRLSLDSERRRRGRTLRRRVRRERASRRQRPPRRRRRQPTPVLVRRPAFWIRAIRMLRASSHGLELTHLDAALSIGLDDPADTGQLFGLLMPTLVMLRPRVPGRLDVRPEFSAATLAGTASGALRIVPLRLAAPALSFGLWLGYEMARGPR